MFRKRIEKKIKEIKEEITLAGSLSLKMLDKSIKSIENQEIKLTEEVVSKLEPELNNLEINIEKKCISILALFKLQVLDLRTITMFIKMNDDLERIGDLAASIASCSKRIINSNTKENNLDLLEEISSKTFSIFVKANQALRGEDVFIAYEVLKMDEEINKIRDQKIEKILSLLKKSTKNLMVNYEIIKIIQKLERIGDLSKNIAEEVIYIVSGDLVKHGEKH